MEKEYIKVCIARWRAMRGYQSKRLTTALIDMDGVLYDSMKYHTLAWEQMMRHLGIDCTRDEFYLYEGMTGVATINLLLERAGRPTLSGEEALKLYKIKTQLFVDMGRKEPMPGADRMLHVLMEHAVRRVLVTGSAQYTLLNALPDDYPGAFLPGDRVTALDVLRGKPSPEPYLKGLEIAGASPDSTIVIENAPLGVKAGVASGCFTIAVTTGPVPRKAFEQAGADIIFPTMPTFADALPRLIACFNES